MSLSIALIELSRWRRKQLRDAPSTLPPTDDGASARTQLLRLARSDAGRAFLRKRVASCAAALAAEAEEAGADADDDDYDAVASETAMRARAMLGSCLHLLGEPDKARERERDQIQIHLNKSFSDVECGDAERCRGFI